MTLVGGYGIDIEFYLLWNKILTIFINEILKKIGLNSINMPYRKQYYMYRWGNSARYTVEETVLYML